MSRAASQRLAALLAQRHFRASGIVLKVSVETKECSMLSRCIAVPSNLAIEHFIKHCERTLGQRAEQTSCPTPSSIWLIRRTAPKST